jgi:uncharacterized protein (TIRG00374 family)
LLLGGAISIVLLWLALRDVAWPEVAATLLATDWLLLVVAVVSVLATTIAKAIRWQLLLLWTPKRPSVASLFEAIVIGQTLNAALPARVGEFARAYLVGEKGRIDKAIVLGGIMVEKALDSLMLLLLLAMVLPVVPLPEWLGRNGLVLSMILLLACVTALLVAAGWGAPWLVRLFKWFPAADRLGLPNRMQAWIDAFKSVTSGRAVLPLLAWSAGIWLLAGFTNYVTFVAVGMEGSVLAAALLLIALQLGLSVPSAPGRIGVFQYVCILALGVFQIDSSRALSYSIVLHLVVFTPMVLPGIVYMARANEHLGVLRSGRNH